MKGIFWLLLITVACGSAVYWYGTSERSSTRDNAARDPSVVTDQSVRPKADAVAPEPTPAPVVVDAKPKPPTAPPLIVDSFAPSERILLDSWTSISEPSGHFDEIRRLRDGAHVEESLLITPTDILIARGWAGNKDLGVRFKDIVLSACGQIIGRAQVGGKRLDVADAVHSNLSSSGWAARILGGDLPFCADSQIRGWTIVPGAQAVLVPLVGSFAYVAPGPVDVPNRLSAQQVSSPNTYPKPRFEFVTVTASKANLRKCGSTSCAVVGQIARGNHFAHISTRGPEWSLILFADQAGWLFNELYETSP